MKSRHSEITFLVICSTAMMPAVMLSRSAIAIPKRVGSAEMKMGRWKPKQHDKSGTCSGKGKAESASRVTDGLGPDMRYFGLS